MADAGEPWALLAATRPDTWDPDEHAERVTTALVEAGVEATVAYGRAFRAALDALFRWDLWGAAYLALGGLGDDGFEYLRCWVVAQGEEVWRRAQDDPEGLFLDLLDGAEDPEEVWVEHGLHEGEPLLYAAGVAHERLTGAWLPAREVPVGEPIGAPWEEGELAGRFPRLAAALGEGWADGGVEGDGGETAVAVLLGPSGGAGTGRLGELMDALVDGLDAFSEGDHERSRALLDPLVDDPTAVAELASVGFDVEGLAYAAGLSRLVAGDVDGAATALRVGVGDGAPEGPLRRALAQVELARGELDAADALIDHGPDAALLDRALQVVVAFRRGAHGEARAGVAAVTGATVADAGHPWDLAGALVQVGLVLVEVGDADEVLAVAVAVDELIDGAPPELPLHGQAMLLRAAALRLAGRHEEAAAALDRLVDVPASDAGSVLLERARLVRDGGGDAAGAYAAAAGAFDGAGERWQAMAARREAGI